MSRRSKESIRTWLRLLSCENMIEQYIRSKFRENFKVTLPQFDALSELEHASDKLTMSQLSKELVVSNGNITGVIDRLEKSGLVKRTRPDHDGRIQFIELTETGAREFKHMARHHERWLEELFAEVPVTDLSGLQNSLLRMRESVSAVTSLD